MKGKIVEYVRKVTKNSRTIIEYEMFLVDENEHIITGRGFRYAYGN